MNNILFIYRQLLTFSDKKSDKALSIALYDLFHKFTYRISHKQSTRPFLYLVYFKRAIVELLKADSKPATELPSVVIFDNFLTSKKSRESYLEGLVDCRLASWHFRSSLPNIVPVYLKITHVIFLFLYYLICVALKRKVQNKTQLALIMLESTEWIKLIFAIKHIKSKKMIFFSPFEKDSNFISYFLTRRLGFTTQFIPSPNPLQNFYKRVVCTTFTFTAPYHKNQVAQISHNWIIENTIKWPTFAHNEIKKILHEYHFPPPKNTIGLMSSGNWLREELGEQNLGKGERSSEAILNSVLQSYIQNNPHIKLIVFLHPFEKKTTERLSKSKAHFRSIYGQQVEFADQNLSSLSFFDRVDLGIGVYSSVLFERLYAGFKTMFTPFEMPYNYFNDDNLLNICIHNPQHFSQRVTAILSLDTDRFFEKYNLCEYRHSNN